MSDGENELDLGMSPQVQASMDRVIEVVRWLDVRQGGRFEDWGCGFADPRGPWVKQYVKRSQYIGIDKSGGVGVDIVQNLVYRTDAADSIFIHHVLTSNGYWHMILDNAMRAFRMRIAIVEGAEGFKNGYSHATMLQAIQTHGRPIKYEQLADGRFLYMSER